MPDIQRSRREKKPRSRLNGVLFSRRFHQAGEIAETGQAPAQVPQSVQAAASITYLLSPSEIALTGHSPAQVPQEIQSSEIM
jgi:hypothetical protein